MREQKYICSGAGKCGVNCRGRKPYRLYPDDGHFVGWSDCGMYSRKVRNVKVKGQK